MSSCILTVVTEERRAGYTHACSYPSSLWSLSSLCLSWSLSFSVGSRLRVVAGAGVRRYTTCRPGARASRTGIGIADVGLSRRMSRDHRVLRLPLAFTISKF